MKTLKDQDKDCDKGFSCNQKLKTIMQIEVCYSVPLNNSEYGAE